MKSVGRIEDFCVFSRAPEMVSKITIAAFAARKSDSVAQAEYRFVNKELMHELPLWGKLNDRGESIRVSFSEECHQRLNRLKNKNGSRDILA